MIDLDAPLPSSKAGRADPQGIATHHSTKPSQTAVAARLWQLRAVLWLAGTVDEQLPLLQLLQPCTIFPPLPLHQGMLLAVRPRQEHPAKLGVQVCASMYTLAYPCVRIGD